MSVLVAKALDRICGAPLVRALAAARTVRELLGDDPRPLRAVREIGVVKLWGVGNAALLLPVLRALKRRYPAARLTVVTLRGNEPIYRAVADRLVLVRPAPVGRSCLDLLRAVATLRRPRLDLALDGEPYAFASQVVLHLAGARQVVAFEPGSGRARLANVRVPHDDLRHAGDQLLALAQAAGVRERAYVPGGLAVEAAAAAWADRWCRRAGVGARPLVVLHPGSGDNFPGRRWPTRRFGLVARRLVDARDAVVAVTGSRAEARLARDVAEAGDGDVFDLAGRLALPELVALLARASLLVSNDTGPVHLASALGVPVLGLYGPNTPRLYGPRSPGSVAFYDAPPCSPCITNENHKTSRCLHPVCIRAIAADDVAAAALGVLAGATRAERRA